MSGASPGLTRFTSRRDNRVEATVSSEKTTISSGRPIRRPKAVRTATTPAETAGHNSHSVENAASTASRITPMASQIQNGWAV